VTLALAILYLCVVVVLPTLALIVAAFRKFMFIRDAASLFDLRQYSLMHFESIFDNPLTMRSIYNAVEVGSSQPLPAARSPLRSAIPSTAPMWPAGAAST
jgi:ABC-type spermidine/putrescine transport system permease subunit I